MVVIVSNNIPMFPTLEHYIFQQWKTGFQNRNTNLQCWRDSVQHWVFGNSNIWQCNQHWNFAYSNTGQVLHPNWDVELSNVGENISNTGYMYNPTSDNSFPTLDHRRVPLWMNCFPHTRLVHFPMIDKVLPCWIATYSIFKLLGPALEIVYR